MFDRTYLNHVILYGFTNNINYIFLDSECRVEAISFNKT